MSAAAFDPDEDLDDLLPDDLAPKGKAVPLRRTPAQVKKSEEAAARAAVSADAARLAQIVNLHIAGFSLAQIGAQIGMTADEVDRMLTNDAQRYVRNQPALRTYVRNFISAKYSGLLEAVWDQSVDKQHPRQLEYVDRSQRILAQMGRLHGAEAPTQTEMKVDAAPEAVERLVNMLASGQGLGYDTDIFDVPDEDVSETIHEAVEQTHAALEVSGNRVEESDGDDTF